MTWMCEDLDVEVDYEVKHGCSSRGESTLEKVEKMGPRRVEMGQAAGEGAGPQQKLSDVPGSSLGPLLVFSAVTGPTLALFNLDQTPQSSWLQ